VSEAKANSIKEAIKSRYAREGQGVGPHVQPHDVVKHAARGGRFKVEVAEGQDEAMQRINKRGIMPFPPRLILFASKMMINRKQRHV
jgi:hypothetical protein